MIHTQHEKISVAIHGTAATNATASSAAIDTAGAHFLSVEATMPAVDATTKSLKLLAFSLQHADAATGAWANIPGFVGVTTTTAAATNFVITGSTSTSTPYAIRLEKDLRGVSRYVRVVYQGFDATNNRVVIRTGLSRLNESPPALADTGFVNVVRDN